MKSSHNGWCRLHVQVIWYACAQNIYKKLLPDFPKFPSRLIKLKSKHTQNFNSLKPHKLSGSGALRARQLPQRHVAKKASRLLERGESGQRTWHRGAIAGKVHGPVLQVEHLQLHPSQEEKSTNRGSLWARLHVH